MVFLFEQLKWTKAVAGSQEQDYSKQEGLMNLVVVKLGLYIFKIKAKL